MLLIHLFGLSGVGKTTLAYSLKEELKKRQYKVEIIDGDEFRRTICKDLTLSKNDRIENIRRLGFVAKLLVRNNVIVILSAISPYEIARQELKETSNTTFNVLLECPIDELIKRDTKGLYRRALLPDNDPEKIFNLTGINDVFELHFQPDMIINTYENNMIQSTDKLISFIEDKIKVLLISKTSEQ
jgi:adenylylsulfate kinase